MPSVVGQWAPIVGTEPRWISLLEEPDYSKYVEVKELESSSGDLSEGEESEEEIAEVEEADEEEQRSPPAEESSERGRGRDPRKGTPAKVEPEGSVTLYKYGSSKKWSSSTSPSARKRKEPLRAAPPAPTRSPKPLYLPPHRRELKAKSKPLSYDPKTIRPAEPEGSPPRARGSLRPPEPEQPPQEPRGRLRSPFSKTARGQDKDQREA